MLGTVDDVYASAYKPRSSSTGPGRSGPDNFNECKQGYIVVCEDCDRVPGKSDTVGRVRTRSVVK